MDLTPAIQAALQAAGVDAHDGDPAATPAGRYAAVYGGTGVAAPHRANQRPHWTTTTARVVCVARTRPGLRDLVADVRHELTGAVLADGFTPLRESLDGPELPGGPPGDVRLSMTITYTATHPTRKE